VLEMQNKSNRKGVSKIRRGYGEGGKPVETRTTMV
jgi:hypothetical protein